MRATRKGDGRVADKVARLLLDALAPLYPGACLGIAAQDFWFQEGDYVKMTWDLARWAADIPIPGQPFKIRLYCWDTMTNCCGGLSLQKGKDDGPNEFEVIALADP
jgi:hypothetical protein